MTLNTPPISGRLLVRQLGSRGACIVGVLHFASHIQIQEGALYLLSVRNGHVMSHLEPLDDGLRPEYFSSGVGDLLHNPIWRGTSIDGVVSVRFFKAFPESNGWAVFGAGQREFPLQADGIGHAWLNVKAGRCTEITAPASAHGEAIGSMLTNFPVWPNAHDEMHTLPGLHSQVRPHFDRHSGLLASLGRNEITQDQYIETVRGDDDLREVAPYCKPDPDYARFVALMHARGMTSATEPQSALVFAARKAAADQCVVEGLLKAS